MAKVVYDGQEYRIGEGASAPLALDAILPAELIGWQETDMRAVFPERRYMRVYTQLHGGLKAILSASIEGDGKRWLHISLSHRGGRVPSWREMCEAKRIFCGDDATAYQVHPPASKHVSMHPACLHLWCPLDGPVTPDFTRGGETI